MPTVQRKQKTLGRKGSPKASPLCGNAHIQLQSQDQMFTCVCPISKNMLSE